MLVLSRKLDQEILIGEEVKITVLRISGNTVRIGIEAVAVLGGRSACGSPAECRVELARIDVVTHDVLIFRKISSAQ